MSWDHVKHYKVNLADEHSKDRVTLFKLIQYEMNVNQGIIYVNSRKKADMLHQLIDVKVNPFLYEVATLHADLSLQDRDNIVKEFNEGFTQILITTGDALSDEVDFSKVTVVVNYDLPVKDDSQEPDTQVYLQRLCFSNATGSLFNMLCGDTDKMIMEKIEKHLNLDVLQYDGAFSDED